MKKRKQREIEKALITVDQGLQDLIVSINNDDVFNLGGEDYRTLKHWLLFRLYDIKDEAMKGIEKAKKSQ